jgi:hypothetical protein
MIEQRFATEIERKHLADTYLFLGGSPSRLKEIALQCASQLLECKGDIYNHADCTIFDPADFGIDGLRVEHVAQRNDKVQSLEKVLRYRALGAGYRAILMYDADRMTIDAMGALLKTTEEPPDKTVLFFTATDLSALTPAFISRCRIWRIAETPVDEALRLAASAGLSDEQYSRLLQVFGNRDVVLELEPKQRQHVLALIEDFDSWLARQLPGNQLVKFAHGAKHLDKRASGIYDLSVVRSLLASVELQDDFMVKQAQWIETLNEGISLLQSQVNPDLVLQNTLSVLTP